jgi:hypothetical protein
MKLQMILAAIIVLALQEPLGRAGGAEVKLANGLTQ